MPAWCLCLILAALGNRAPVLGLYHPPYNHAYWDAWPRREQRQVMEDYKRTGVLWVNTPPPEVLAEIEGLKGE